MPHNTLKNTIMILPTSIHSNATHCHTFTYTNVQPIQQRNNKTSKKLFTPSGKPPAIKNHAHPSGESLIPNCQNKANIGNSKIPKPKSKNDFQIGKLNPK